MPFLSAERLKNYPRLMLLVVCLMMGANLLLHQGWVGGFGQIIGHDYLVFYSTGMLYRTEPDRIYDFEAHNDMQQSLVHPTPLDSINPNSNPPYAAMAFSLLTALPLFWSFFAWTILTPLFAVLAVRWIMPLVPEKLARSGLNQTQLNIIVLSFFPFVEGWQVGQNHALTLLLTTGIVVSMFADRWTLAGIFAGSMLYKPQYVLGLLILFVVWRQYRALAAFTAVTITWAGSYLLLHGWTPYLTYLGVSSDLMQLPYNPGFPAYLLLTPYGLLTTALPQTAWPFIAKLISLVGIGLAIALAAFAYRIRHRPLPDRAPAVVLALLYPVATAPYALLHDMLILVPGFILWSRYDGSRRLLQIASGTYLCAFFVPLLAYQLKVALMALVTIGLVAEQIRWIIAHRDELFSLPPEESRAARESSAV